MRGRLAPYLLRGSWRTTGRAQLVMTVEEKRVSDKDGMRKLLICESIAEDTKHVKFPIKP